VGDGETDKARQQEFRATADAALARWGCTPDGDVFFTHSSLLWPVTRDGDALMLKVPDPGDDEAHGAAVLRYFDGHGAVRLVDSDGHVQLLERVGTDAGALDRDLLLRFTYLHLMQCAAWSLNPPDQKYWRACARAAASLAGIDGHAG